MILLTITVTASSIVADHAVQLDAGRDLTITTAQSTQTNSGSFQQKTSGVFFSGPSITLGSKEQQDRTSSTSVTNVGSNIASLNGNATLTAGNQFTQTGSQLVTPAGNIDITAKRVDINAATNTGIDTEQHEFKQSGLTLAVSSPVITAVQTGQQMSQAASQTKDSRMQAMAAITAGLAAKNAIDAVSNTGLGGGVGLSLSLGSSQSKSDSTRSSTTAIGSTIAAGGDVSIRASAANPADPADKASSNINVTGSTITAGNNAALTADGAITLQAASSTAEQHSSNRSSSASVGVGIMVGGAQSGLSVSASANAARGKADGNDVTRTNSQVTAGEQVALQSGGDTTLKGAVVGGKQVTANVGGNLNIESLQDTSVFNAKQQSAGFGISVPIGPGSISGSVNASNAKVNGRYANVEQQSGIQAGDDGFQIQVNGNTDLKGGVIASSVQAAANDKNRLTTATLTTSDIANSNTYQANSVGIGISMSGPSGTGGTNNQGTSKVGAGLTGTSVGVGSASGNDSSTTRSGISNGVITLTDDAAQQARTGRDTETTIASLNRAVVSGQDSIVGNNGTALKKTWDGQQQLQDVTAQTQITAAFGQAAAKTIGDVADKKMEEAKVRGDKEAEKNWSEGGIYRVALHTAAGALAGGVQGAAGAATSATALPNLAKLIDNIDAPDSVKQALAQVGAAALGGAVGGAAGLASAVNVEANNRQLHPSETKRIRELAAGDPQKEFRLTEAACALVHCADGVPKDDPAYVYLKALQDAGQSLTAEKNLLGAQKGWEGRSYGSLFGYTGVDQYIVDPLTQNRAAVRLEGAVQAGASAIGLAGDGLACTTGIGCTAAAVTGTMLVDNLITGSNKVATGQPTVTYGEQVLKSLGMSPEAAAIAYALVGVSPVAAEAVLSNAASKARAAENVAARADYGTSVGASSVELAATRASVDDKLTRYLLNVDHPIGGPKAKWFDSALGFNQGNAQQLANQIVFNEASAVQTAVIERGIKFNQVIPITGANGRVIDVTFGWIRNNDGVVRLTTGVPTKK